MTIETEVQQTETSPYVELFQIDLTLLGGPNLFLVRGSFDSASVMFDGQVYTPFDLEADGFEWNSQGSAPTPRIRINTGTLAIVGYINSLNDFVGGTVTRTRTFQKFLDNQEESSPTEFLSKDVYTINTKISENKYQVEFELTSKMDQQGLTLPKGKIVPYCQSPYRRYVNGAFVYAPADIACPYQGTNYYTENGNTTGDPALDYCPHTPNGCKLRFGPTGQLPFYGFPGTSRPTI